MLMVHATEHVVSYSNVKVVNVLEESSACKVSLLITSQVFSHCSHYRALVLHMTVVSHIIFLLWSSPEQCNINMFLKNSVAES